MRYDLYSCQWDCESLDNVIMLFGTKFDRIIVFIPMETNCTHQAADYFLSAYVRDFPWRATFAVYQTVPYLRGLYILTRKCMAQSVS